MFTLNLKGACPMSPLVYQMNAVLSRGVHRVPVGTNLGLFHCLWMLLRSRLLLNRGAVIPVLAALGLAEKAVRRARAALAYGQWHAAQLRERGSRAAGRSRPFLPTSLGAIALGSTHVWVRQPQRAWGQALDQPRLMLVGGSRLPTGPPTTHSSRSRDRSTTVVHTRTN
jgi:hypothetical protein